ncbi:hypothetical protein BKA62DRAFT_716715 [Auriculariales sp. MPI-PUGE-AT-0066]|nr:hypothetical protein BKA62DRAFT_716715 [Auriculariales sp. MPI-PUGE-AT-0066]
MERLPVELVAYIVQLAAYLFRSSDRVTVLNLAVTSWFVYHTVAPILHERIVIESAEERQTFLKLIHNELVAVKVLKHVRFLCTGTWYINTSPLAPMLVKIKTIYGPIGLWNDIAFAQAARGHAIASDLRLWTADLPRDLKDVHRSSLQSLTRVHTFISYSSFHVEDTRDPARWTRSILDQLPHLTHLGFSHVDPEQVQLDAEERGPEDLGLILSMVSACQQPCIQVLALRITGRVIKRLSAYIRIALAGDAEWAMRRLCIWVDQRDIADWKTERELIADDARRERTIWTEAKSLRWYVEAPDEAT